MALGPLAHGVAGGLVGKYAGSLADGVVNKIAPAVAKPYANLAAAAAGKAAMGIGAGAANGAATYATNTVGTGQFTGAGLGDAAGEGAGTGGIMGALGGAGIGLKGARQVAKSNSVAAKAGVADLNTQMQPWLQAVQKNTQAIQAQNPEMSPQDVQAQAEAQAQAAGVSMPGYSDLTPTARNGLTQLGLQNLYNGREYKATIGQGLSAGSANPSAVFKGVMDDLKGTLTDIGGGLDKTGQVSPDEANALTAAIREAVTNNRTVASGDGGPAYMDTALDRVGASNLPPMIRNTLLSNLAMLNMAQQNSMKMAAKGPLQQMVPAVRSKLGMLGIGLLGGAGVATGAHSGGALDAALMGTAGLGLGAAAEAALNMGAKAGDKALGLNLPPALRNAPALQAYANRNGLNGVVAAPGDIMALRSQVQQATPGAPVTPTVMPLSNPPALSKWQARNAAQSNTQPPQVDPMATAKAVVALQQLEAQKQQTAADTNLNNVKRYFPVLGTTWQNRISQDTGIPVSAIQDHMQDMVNQGLLPLSEHTRLSQASTLPLGEYAGLADYMRNQLGTQGSGGSQGRGSTPAQLDANGDPILNPAAYQGAIQNSQIALQNVLNRHPELADQALAIHGQRPQADKQALLHAYYSTEKDPLEQEKLLKVLGPLTLFGSRAN